MLLVALETENPNDDLLTKIRKEFFDYPMFHLIFDIYEMERLRKVGKYEKLISKVVRLALKI